MKVGRVRITLALGGGAMGAIVVGAIGAGIAALLDLPAGNGAAIGGAIGLAAAGVFTWAVLK